tara:strand:- start:99905 stop:101074 length:1170 start_codon:yes stop_codon:yes gene_type:complete
MHDMERGIKMSMPYSKTVSYFACLLSLTGLYGCQSAQQKVHQQASRASSNHVSTPYHQSESLAPEYQNPGQFYPESAPAPADADFPPAAPPSLLPQPDRQSYQNDSFIRKTSQEEVAADQEYFKSQFSAEPVEPAQKNLGLVPRYSSVSSSVSQKVKQMNGKVKDFCSKVKSQVKTPQWIRNVSDTEVEVEVVEVVDELHGEISCIESTPYPGPFPVQAEPVFPEPMQPQPVFPQPLHSLPQPVLPQPEPAKKALPRLPPPGEATYWDNSWRVSVSRESLPVSSYSTLEDELELWPYSKQRMQQEAQVKQFDQFKTAVPVSTPAQLKNEVELTNPRDLSVPSMLSQEQSAPIRKIGLQSSQNHPKPNPVEPSIYAPYTPLPMKAPTRNY